LRHEVQSEHAIEAHVDPLPAQDQLYYQRQLRRKLNEILERLPEDLRTAFVLFEFEGLSVPEIANATNTKLGTVSSRLRRARELFQQGVKRLRTQGLIEGESA
jgi:RNA polymerase sigma-70 factor (ECF subfamily)